MKEALSAGISAPRIAMGPTRAFTGKDFSFGIKAHAINNPFKTEAKIAPVRVAGPLNKAEVVAEAKHWLGIVEPVARPGWTRFMRPLEWKLPKVGYAEPLVKPKIERAVQVAVTPSMEIHPQPQIRAAVEIPKAQSTPQIKQKEQINQDVTQIVTEVSNKNEEDLEQVTKKYLEDEETMEARDEEKKMIIKIVFTQALDLGKKVTGPWLRKFMREHIRNKSRVTKGDDNQEEIPDGTNEERFEEVESLGELDTPGEAEKKLSEIDKKHVAVKLGKWGESGKRVNLRQVWEVLKYKKVKPAKVEYVTSIFKRRLAGKEVVEYSNGI